MSTQTLIKVLDQASATIVKALSSADLKQPVPEPVAKQIEAAINRVSVASMSVALALSGADLRPPVPRLTDEQATAVNRQGKLHPWSKRTRDDRRWPHQWVRDFYGGWIPGLLTSHILHADPELYAAFMKDVNRNGLPPELDVPTEPENRIRGISDPGKRLAVVAARRKHAARIRKLRST